MAVEGTRNISSFLCCGRRSCMGSMQNKKQADEYSRRRHHRGSGFCGFDYCATVALANAQNYLKIYIYISDNAAPKKRRRFFVSQKGATVETELEKALDTLYTKTVPAGVRDFIDMKSGTVSSSAVPKPRKPKPMKTEPTEVSEVSVNERH